MPFPKALAQNEMQTASSRIWTRVAKSVFNNNNSSTKHASIVKYD